MTVAKRKSTDVSDLRDARARRTRQRLDAAFVELLHRRAYDGIRVSDIARKGGVGRATFYAHYTGKDALLRSQMDRVVAPMIVAMDEPAPLDATRLFQHVLDRPRLYGTLMAGTGRRVVEECLEKRLVDILLAHEARIAHPRAIATPLAARVLASALVGLASWCVEHASGGTVAAVQQSFRALCEGLTGT